MPDSVRLGGDRAALALSLRLKLVVALAHLAVNLALVGKALARLRVGGGRHPLGDVYRGHGLALGVSGNPSLDLGYRDSVSLLRYGGGGGLGLGLGRLRLRLVRLAGLRLSRLLSQPLGFVVGSALFLGELPSRLGAVGRGVGSGGGGGVGLCHISKGLGGLGFEVREGLRLSKYITSSRFTSRRSYILRESRSSHFEHQIHQPLRLPILGSVALVKT